MIFVLGWWRVKQQNTLVKDKKKRLKKFKKLFEKEKIFDNRSSDIGR